ncbi:MAG: hypothetical protein D4R74_07595 [Betaproteobacteria bacterium]|nr:MAG: hypothetical protein D4R74_07595 [Betaproteobacteria bacterium]
MQDNELQQRHNWIGKIMFKLQVQEDEKDPQAWHDVNGADGKLLIFEKETAARAKLEQLYPILVKMERYAADTKRTRVISIYAEDDS